MFISFRKITTASVLMYIILQELINNHELSKKFIINRDKLFTSRFLENAHSRTQDKLKDVDNISLTDE
jgi:hypothetical protein